MKKILLGFTVIVLFTFLGCEKDDGNDTEKTQSNANVKRYFFDRSIAEDIIVIDSVVLLTQNGESSPTKFRSSLSYKNSLNSVTLGMLCDTLIVGEYFEQIKTSLETVNNNSYLKDSLNLCYLNGDYKREDNQISFSGVLKYSGEEVIIEHLFIKENNHYVAQLFHTEVLHKDNSGSLILGFSMYFPSEPTIDFVSKNVSLKIESEAILDSVYFRKAQIPFVLEE